MRAWLLNKNISLYWILRRRLGKVKALRVHEALERVILIFGRPRYPGGGAI